MVSLQGSGGIFVFEENCVAPIYQRSFIFVFGYGGTGWMCPARKLVFKTDELSKDRLLLQL